MILTKEQVEKYRNRSISGFELPDYAYGVKDSDIEMLREKEAGLEDGTMPYYLAKLHHLDGKNMKEISEEIGLPYHRTTPLFKVLGISRMTKSETRRRRSREAGNGNSVPARAETIMDAYDRHMPATENLEELYRTISGETGFSPDHIRRYLKRHLHV